jgi:hypothetical protein
VRAFATSVRIAAASFSVALGDSGEWPRAAASERLHLGQRVPRFLDEFAPGDSAQNRGIVRPDNGPISSRKVLSRAEIYG